MTQMTLNPHDPKHAPHAPGTPPTGEPIPQWKLAAFLPLPFLVACVICFWHAFRIRAADEILAGFFLAFGVGALILYVVAVVLLGFFGHALGMKIYPVHKNDS
jgi:hypothetical protein